MRGFSEDFTRPLLLGYLRRDLLVVDGQVGELQRRMTTFAKAEGFDMGHIYVEDPERWLAAFEGLTESISCYKANAVILPSLLHIIGLGLGPPTSARSLFEWMTGARVLVLSP
jgi:hypothetical protein